MVQFEDGLVTPDELLEVTHSPLSEFFFTKSDPLFRFFFGYFRLLGLRYAFSPRDSFIYLCAVGLDIWWLLFDSLVERLLAL